MSLGLELSAVPTQTSPVGPMSSASTQVSAMRPGVPAGSSAVAVVSYAFYFLAGYVASGDVAVESLEAMPAAPAD